VTGGKKTGAGPLAMKREARELAVALEEAAGGARRAGGAPGRIEPRDRRPGSRAGAAAGVQQAREKDRVALDHEMRKLGDDLARANSRLSVARLELERLRRDAEKSAEQRERNRTAVAEKERLRAQREEALEAERQELEKLEARRRPSAKSTPPRAPSWPAWKSAIAASGRHGPAGAAVPGDTARRNAIAPEIERLGEQRARLLADNIELDRKIAELAEEITALEAASMRWRRRTRPHARALRAGEEELKTTARGGGGVPREALADRSRAGAQAGRAEVSRRDQPQGVELPGGGTGAGDDPVPDADAIAAAERLQREVRSASKALGPVNQAAMEEFQEAQQRQEFLSVQRQDLIDSIRDTEKAIQEIDRSRGRNSPKPSKPSTPISARRSRRCSAAAPARCASPTRRTWPNRASTSSARLPASGCRTCCCYRAARRRWRRWRC
jgi:chromosome segregation protein